MTRCRFVEDHRADYHVIKLCELVELDRQVFYRKNSFESVLLMWLAFLPYDGVNYAAGLLRINPLGFLLATAIGSLPGTVSFTLAGASIDSLSDGPAGVDPIVFAISVVLFVVSIAVSRIVKTRTSSDLTSNPVVEVASTR